MWGQSQTTQILLRVAPPTEEITIEESSPVLESVPEPTPEIEK
jgi:hypothetical protein